MNKRVARIRRSQHTRAKIKILGREKGYARLIVYRSSRHIYAQILEPVGGKVLAFASSRDKEFDAKSVSKDEGKIGPAKLVGKMIAQRAAKAGVKQVACDRSGFKYHGRIAALVDAARENGLMV